MPTNEPLTRTTDLSALAHRLIDVCPVDLAAVATLGGSVAAGCADEFSDIEIHVWSEQPTTREDRARLLDQLDATNIWWHAKAGKDGSEWVRFDAMDETFELGWQTTDSFSQVVEALATGQPWGKGRIGLGWVITRGAPLRGNDTLAEAQRRLTPYPAELRRIVAGATIVNQWLDPRRPVTLRALGERDQWFRLADELMIDALTALRVLFAVNGRYEPPNWKWMEREARDLDIAPDEFVPRLRGALTDVYVQPVRAVESMTALIRETITVAGYDLEQTGYAYGR